MIHYKKISLWNIDLIHYIQDKFSQNLAIKFNLIHLNGNNYN